MLIRRLETSDFQEWSALWALYLKFYGTSRSPAFHQSYFQKLQSPPPFGMQARVAEKECELVGLTHFTYHAHGWQDAPICYLQDLFTLPEARGMGVAEQLIRTVDAEAQKDGASGLYWMTQQDNAVARRLYDRVGVQTDFIKYTGPAS